MVHYMVLCSQVALSSTFCNFLEADVPGRDFSKLDDAQVRRPSRSE